MVSTSPLIVLFFRWFWQWAVVSPANVAVVALHPEKAAEVHEDHQDLLDCDVHEDGCKMVQVMEQESSSSSSCDVSSLDGLLPAEIPREGTVVGEYQLQEHLGHLGWKGYHFSDPAFSQPGFARIVSTASQELAAHPDLTLMGPEEGRPGGGWGDGEEEGGQCANTAAAAAAAAALARPSLPYVDGASEDGSVGAAAASTGDDGVPGDVWAAGEGRYFLKKKFEGGSHGEQAGQSPYDWQKFLVLRVEEAALAADGGWRPATGHYEAIVHFSKARYAFPHAAVVQAWRLSGPEGTRAERIEVALPPEPSWWESDGQKGFMVVCGAIACSALVRFIRVKFIDKLFGGGVKKPQEGEEVVGESTRLSSKDKTNMKKGNKSSVSRKKKD